MGSKTPEKGHHDHHGGSSSNSDTAIHLGGEPKGSHSVRDGDGCVGDMGGGDDDDDDDDNDGNESEVKAEAIPSSLVQKKRKKPRKKRSKKSKGPTNLALKQSSPPKGELQPYENPERVEGTTRTTAAEVRHEDRKYWEDYGFLQDYRKAAEVHRQARHWLRETVKPGQTLQHIVETIEDSVRAMLGNAGLGPGDDLKSGMGFPTGICLNQQVAHYTPSPGQKEVTLHEKDVVTVDFGVHVNGWIVDSAFTTAFDPIYDPLLTAVRDATNAGIKTAGIDVRISDVGAAIQETMESYEVEIGGKTFRVKAVRNLTGHNIKRYHIHGGKSIPFVKHSDQTKMEEGEVFAIETFGTTGRGYVYDDAGVYGYGLNRDAPLHMPVVVSSAKRLHKLIRENFGTLVFCRRYLDRLGVDKYLAGMNYLVSNGIVEQYRPLTDIKGSYSAQFEHTFLLRNTHKEVFSRGKDY